METLFCKQSPVKPTNSLTGNTGTQGGKDISQTDGSCGTKKKDTVSCKLLLKICIQEIIKYISYNNTS